MYTVHVSPIQGVDDPAIDVELVGSHLVYLLAAEGREVVLSEREVDACGRAGTVVLGLGGLAHRREDCHPGWNDPAAHVHFLEKNVATHVSGWMPSSRMTCSASASR